jgi:hypothetical protein
MRFDRRAIKERAEGIIASMQIRSHETEKGSFVISLPKLSSIKIEQHERGDHKAQRRSQEQTRYIKTHEKNNRHEKKAQPGPQDFASIEEQISGAPRPKPDCTLHLSRIKRVRRDRTFLQQRGRRKAGVLFSTATENLIQKPGHRIRRRFTPTLPQRSARRTLKPLESFHITKLSAKFLGEESAEQPKRLMIPPKSAEDAPWPHRNSILSWTTFARP